MEEVKLKGARCQTVGHDVAGAAVDEEAGFKLWSVNKAALEKKIQYAAGVSWSECLEMAEAASLMLCGNCRAGVSFARECNSKNTCYGTLCRLCSDAGILCHNHVAGELSNDF